MNLKNTIGLFLIGVMLATPFAFACPPLLVPDTAHLSQYKTIFIGEVSNVRQMPQADWQTQCINGRHNATYCRSTLTGPQTRPTYEISVLPRTSIMDGPSGMVKIQLQGCGEQIPRVRGYGIFFLPKDLSRPIVPIYQSEPLLYTNLLLKLGALKPDSSNWDKLEK
ncbi:MAG: hypothetical protein WBR29_05135 [Gammaproteobacteria bacterium]